MVPVRATATRHPLPHSLHTAINSLLRGFLTVNPSAARLSVSNLPVGALLIPLFS
jgi:hypothetical protein